MKISLIAETGQSNFNKSCQQTAEVKEMSIDRAIEILDPTHREHYESIEPINEACKMGMKALWRLKPLSVSLEEIVYDLDWNDKMIIKKCPSCSQRLTNKTNWCPNCGQALLWEEEEQWDML